MTEMGDDEFLSYCDAHADTPRCGFVPAHLARLARLAGDDLAAGLWEEQPHGIYDMDRHWVANHVKLARELLGA